ncbi:NUDIX domain-containing protein [Streptomyces sp. SAJ15]|uniref:NUDIX domain-containing protein n=1 Tax=Streptomyces sp. SAJ15 TaxID=2011095 RepID=UPI0011871221|nr:NUDIX domain-containing protein [Streptomyces sp. SAJ15]TVL88778.1 NUDIX hydrolase [Streptomyces sp. SAJ15]
MTAKRSAGILLFRRRGPEGDDIEVLLGHMGGPLWAARDERAWSVPKGEYASTGESAEEAARREFEEEIGLPPPVGRYLPLGEVRQRNGKIVTAWAVRGDLDPELMVPGTFTMEWPRGSGRIQEFPELDRVGWWGLDQARDKLVTAQVTFLDRLAELLGAARG